MRAADALGLAGAAAAVVAAAVHAAPTVGSFRPIGTRLTPGLSGVGRAGHVALTFDDGPDPTSTPLILRELDRLGWTATFFMLGEMAGRAPGLAQEVAAAGHEVAVHGFEHRNMLRRLPGSVRDDIARARVTVAEASGTVPRWFRPPYGLTPAGAVRSASRLGLRTVLWTAWGYDWAEDATAESVVARVVGGRLDGGTILLHDSDCTSSPGSWRSTLGALPRLADELAARGLAVGPLLDHDVRGVVRS